MKLSEAIRLGAMMKPQGRGGYFTCRDEKSCAWGAVMDAVGEKIPDTLRIMFPLLCAEISSCPVGGCYSMTDAVSPNIPQVGGWLVHLNDNHLWAREDIADWVESIENQQEAQAVEAEKVEVTA